VNHFGCRRAIQACSVLALGVAFPLLSGIARSADFPEKSIHLIVPGAAGGNSDAFARILAQKLSERVGQGVIVENRGGAGGTIAAQMTAKSAPDGYTLVVADTGTHAIAPTLYSPRLLYDVIKDFTPITLAVTFPIVVLAHPSLPASNAKDLIALIKSQPGKFSYSSGGTGNGSHLVMEMFSAAAGDLKLVHVPYKGGAPAVQALMANDVQLTAISVGTAMPFVKSGKARAIAVASRKRSSAMPDVQTFLEAGVPLEADNWLAILGPAGIPPDIAKKLHADITATLLLPQVRERLSAIGLEVVASSPAELNKMMVTEVTKWGKAVKDSGAVAE
jgi:tripartite-type tricarboxylate transporter receptor subunit TctC